MPLPPDPIGRQSQTAATLNAEHGLRLAFMRQAAGPRRFLVSVQHPDGQVDTWQRTGGSACDHAQEAHEFGGLGSVVRIVPLNLAEAAS